MAIQTGLESLANLEATRASTEMTKQQTHELKETFGTRKRAAELTLEQAEYQFDELKANRPTRDALNALQVTTAQQMHQHLIDNPHYFSAKLQVELDAKKWELEDKVMGRIYDMQYARGQEIQRALESGDPDAIERANFHFQALQQEYQSTTGEPFDIGIEREGFQGLTLQHLPFVREMNRVAAHMGPYARERANLMIQNQPDAGDILTNIEKTQKIQGTHREEAGNALINFGGELGTGITMTSKGEIIVEESHANKKSKAQFAALHKAIEDVTPVNGDHDATAAAMNEVLESAVSSPLLGGNFNYIKPIGKLAEDINYNEEQFLETIRDRAKREGISLQKAADLEVQKTLEHLRGYFSNMVTSKQ